MSNQTNHQPKRQSNVVTLSKDEFNRLKQQAAAYRFLATKVFELPLQDPIENVVKDFEATGLYTDEFFEDLTTGLRKSSYYLKSPINKIIWLLYH